MKYHTHTLKNGQKLLFLHHDKINLIYVNIGIKIGSDIETKETLELSHFMEHLFTLFTSSKYNNGLTNRNYLSQNNINLNAEVTTKNTNFQYIFDKKNLNRFFDMLTHALNDFTIDKKLFENEKESVIEELNSIINDADYKFETEIDKTVYKNHTRSYSQKLRLENTKKIKPQDVLDFFKKYYRPENMVVSIYGKVRQKEIIDLMEKINKKFIKQTPCKSVNLYNLEKNFKMNIPLEKKVLHVKESKESNNLKIVFQVPYKFFDDEYYTIFSILNILTYDISSILLNKLRNVEGLIYDISATMELDEVSQNISVVYFETNVENSKMLRVIQIIIKTLNEIKEKSIPQSYINFYKENLRIKYEKEKVQFDPMRVLEEYTKYILWDEKIVDYEGEFFNFGNVNKSKIKKISNDIFNLDNIFIAYSSKNNLNKKIHSLLK